MATRLYNNIWSCKK